MATSGTVGQTVFTTQQVVDHAFRRCRLTPQQVTAEHLQTAQELLWLVLSTWTTRGIALWCVDRPLIGLQEARSDIQLPAGTLDVLNANLRTISALSATTQQHGSGLNNYYQSDLSAAQQVTHVGFRFNASGTYGFAIQTSTDGVGYTTRVTVTPATFSADSMNWYDVAAAGAATTSVRIFADTSSSIGLNNVTIGSSPMDVPMAVLDRDTYSSLSNKQFLGRPLQYWYDRQRGYGTTRGQPVMALWPAPSSAYVTTSMVSLFTHRQIQDVGTLTQELELPQRWYLAAVAELARNLSAEIKEVDPALQGPLAAEADRQLRIAWDGETDRAPVRLLPNIRGYTR